MTAGDAYMKMVWEKSGSELCHNCDRPIFYDNASGYWIHVGFEEIDGQNGLYCDPGMWDGSVPKVYAKPSQRWAAWGTGR